MHKCEACGDLVRPESEPGVVCATALDPGGGFGVGQSSPVERGPVYFHSWCYPARSGHYRQRPMAEVITDGGE